ncbi:MAG: DUF86 domain-containing protein [Candidatus Micrarchaeota archaeon]
MSRDVSALLVDMLESIHKIETYAAGLDEKSFGSDSRAQDAVIRRLEIIGEASKGLPERIKTGYPHVPWKEIAGMRDVLIHSYFGVNATRVWNVVQTDLPPLKDALASSLEAESAPAKGAR